MTSVNIDQGQYRLQRTRVTSDQDYTGDEECKIVSHDEKLVLLVTDEYADEREDPAETATE